MTAPQMNAEEITKLFEDIAGKKVAELREEFGSFKKSRRTLDTVHVNEKNGAVTVDDHEDRGLGFAKMARAVATAKMSKSTPLEVMKDWAAKDAKRTNKIIVERNDKIIASIETKALEAQRAESAGLLVEDDLRDEIIELLRAALIFEGNGATTLPMPNGTLSMRYQKTGVTGAYVGERRPIVVQQPSLGMMKMMAHKLGVLVGITNDLLRYAGPEVDRFVRNDIIEGLTHRKDIAMLRDDGTQDTPKGARWSAPAGSFVDRTLDAGNVTLKTVVTDLARAAARLDGRNIRMRRPVWLMHPNVKWFLFALLDGLGHAPFRADIERNMIFGIPVRTSTAIPNNLGGGGNESEIYLIDFASVIVGEAVALQIDTSDEASYIDGSGTVHTFQQDETVVRAIMAHDVGFRYRGAEIVGITAVDWQP